MAQSAEHMIQAKNTPFFILFAIAACGLYASSLYSFLLFHTLIEIFCVFVLFSVFLLCWNARRLLDNHYLLFLAISFLSSGTFELVHTLAFKGFSVFPGYGANLPTQLWIVFRYVFSLSFLVAPFFMNRRLNLTATLSAFILLTILLNAAIFSGNFPDCFVEGKGLTPFKIISEGVIIVILFGAIGLLLNKQTRFDPRVLRTLIASIGSAIAAEATFTQYFSVYGPASVVGHLFLFFSAFLLFKALVATGVKEPAALLFRDLELSKKALRESKDRYVSIHDHAPFAISLMRSPEGTITEVNASWEKMFACSREEAIGRTAEELGLIGDVDAQRRMYQEMQAQGWVRNWEISYRTRSGEYHQGSFSFDLIEINGQKFHLGTMIDITERRQAEAQIRETTVELQAVNRELEDSRRAAINLLDDAIIARRRAEEATAGLRESEERLRLFIEYAPAGLAMFDRDMRYLFASRRWRKDYNLGDRDLAGVSHYEVFPEISEEWKKVHQRGLTGEVMHSEADLFVRNDGSSQWLRWEIRPWTDVAGDIGGIVIFAEDITARKQAEEALKASEEKFATAFAMNPAAISLTRLADGLILDVNETMLAMTGYRREEFMGHQILHLRFWPTPEDRLHRIEELREKGAIYNSEQLLLKKSGEALVALFSAELLTIAGEEVILSSWLDITERKAAEEAIKASLREKEVLLKEVHHRVKNNLQVISSLVSLQADGLEEETVREVLRDVMYRVRSMALVHEKLYQSAELARVDFAEYTRSLLNYLWRAHGSAAAAIGLKLELEPLPLPVDTAVPCGLILNELASNALKHAFHHRDEGVVTVALSCGADRVVRLGVRDDGTGMPPDLDWHQSSSLGLRLVHMLARQLNATVELNRGIGTEFVMTFNLPDIMNDWKQEHE